MENTTHARKMRAGNTPLFASGWAYKTLSGSLYAAPAINASQSFFVRLSSAVPVGLQCCHVGGVALQLDNLVTTPRHVKVGSKGPLAHTPIPNGALASLAHALHFALTPIGLTSHRTEVFLHLDANVVCLPMGLRDLP